MPSASLPPNPRPPEMPVLHSQQPPNPSSRLDSTTSPQPPVAIAAPKPRSTSFPFTFRRPFQPRLSSTSLEPSTAEGKPIPVDDSTVESRTSALRHLNKTNPSRHRYAKSTGAQSSTYSEPVIVRSYYSPASARAQSSSRGGIIITNRRTPPRPQAPVPTTSLSRSMPFVGKAASARDGVLNGMAKVTGKKRWGIEQAEEPKLPPVAAFTFKSFLDNIEAQADGSDINADLDRIAEICARSKYSLSTQYEVHYTPHGSGSSFMDSGAREHDSNGPTLQAVTPEEENSTRSRRRRLGRRNSRAMGTLETIMSSSRSSDEDKSHKRSAAEIAEDVRGRAARQHSGDSSPISQTQTTGTDDASQDGHVSPSKVRPGRSASLALIDGQRQTFTARDAASPRASSQGLLSEPALPQTSTSQLEIRTAPEDGSDELSKDNHAALTERLQRPLALGPPANIDDGAVGEGIFSAFSSWMPWSSSAAPKSSARAEGSLRDLLKSTDVKGKSTEGQA